MSPPPAAVTAAAAPLRARLAWGLFDWANSAFGAVIGTFVFATYFSQAVAADPATGTAQWGYALTASGLTVAVLSPVLGAIADRGGRRKPWLLGFTALAVAGCAALWSATPSTDAVLRTLVLFGLANVGVEMGIVFYNAMLPDLAAPGRVGRLSGMAWAMGYAGGMACLLIALVAFVQAETPPFGLDRERAEHVRIIGPYVAAWLAVFSAPLFLLTPDRPGTGLPVGEAVRRGVRTVADTLIHLRRYRRIALFLLARMVYTDGLNTLLAFGGLYAAGTFGMDLAEVIRFGITLNVSAGVGAFAFSWVDDRIGPKRTILLAIAGLLTFGSMALLVEDATAFWVAGTCLGVFVGPAQAASRSLMARLAPEELRTEMFGLYALSGKATAFLGPFVLGAVTLWADSQRAGMATILVFLVAGAALLLAVRESPPR